MYIEHFGFNEDPFGVSPDPRFLYLGPVHHEAFAALLYGIKMRRGFMCLIGEPGTGKTTLLYALLERLEDHLKTVFLPGTDLTFKQRLQFIIESLSGRQVDGTVLSLTRQLQDLLAEEWRAGSNVVLIFDEAQNLAVREMEDIRLLTNFETPRAKLLQVILVGQPGLREKLALPELAQLKQRITVNVSLRPLTLAETGEYIEHRLRVAGWTKPLHELFSRSVIAAVYEASRGVPRLINAVCHNALLIAYAENKMRVDLPMIEEAATELDLVEAVERREPVAGPLQSAPSLAERPVPPEIPPKPPVVEVARPMEPPTEHAERSGVVEVPVPVELESPSPEPPQVAEAVDQAIDLQPTLHQVEVGEAMASSEETIDELMSATTVEVSEDLLEDEAARELPHQDWIVGSPSPEEPSSKGGEAEELALEVTSESSILMPSSQKWEEAEEPVTEAHQLHEAQHFAPSVEEIPRREDITAAEVDEPAVTPSLEIEPEAEEPPSAEEAKGAPVVMDIPDIEDAIEEVDVDVDVVLEPDIASAPFAVEEEDWSVPVIEPMSPEDVLQSPEPEIDERIEIELPSEAVASDAIASAVEGAVLEEATSEAMEPLQVEERTSTPLTEGPTIFPSVDTVPIARSVDNEERRASAEIRRALEESVTSVLAMATPSSKVRRTTGPPPGASFDAVLDEIEEFIALREGVLPGSPLNGHSRGLSTAGGPTGTAQPAPGASHRSHRTAPDEPSLLALERASAPSPPPTAWMILLSLVALTFGVVIGIYLRPHLQEVLKQAGLPTVAAPEKTSVAGPTPPAEMKTSPSTSVPTAADVGKPSTATRSTPLPVARPTIPEPPARHLSSRKANVRYVSVRRGDTLGKILRRHYGYVNNRLVQAVQAVNPEVKDWNLLEVGQRLRLPVDPEAVLSNQR
ncbi:MAG: AAA family ATPase [Acidobacteria bacterium]|nr:MAG: AAA family ATPase [Acidobacteriota bacterium]